MGVLLAIEDPSESLSKLIPTGFLPIRFPENGIQGEGGDAQNLSKLLRQRSLFARFLFNAYENTTTKTDLSTPCSPAKSVLLFSKSFI